MPRPPRIDFPGAWHHVFDRGRLRQAIFFDDDDRLVFFDCIAEAVKQYCIEVHAYSLLPNHFHLLVRSLHGDLSRAIRHLKSLYTQQMNVRRSLYNDTGHINWKKADLTASIKELSRPVERDRTIESVMQELTEITGVTIAQLRQDQRRPAGNQAKRFAVWALRERTTLSYAQIGKQLKMTESAVSKTLAKRRQPSESIDQWSAQWLTRHENRFAVVFPEED